MGPFLSVLQPFLLHSCLLPEKVSFVETKQEIRDKSDGDTELPSDGKTFPMTRMSLESSRHLHGHQNTCVIKHEMACFQINRRPTVKEILCKKKSFL